MTIDPETLLRAYSIGLFPMADSREAEDVFWVEPRDRAILPLKKFHMSRSLRKTLRRDIFELRCNHAFADVVQHCAAAAPDREESWINQSIHKSYQLLHHIGHAHSVECWQQGRLVGGLYGVSLGKVFCGESMFSLADNASKTALAALVTAMRMAGFQLLDCQFMTDHLASLGATEIRQEDYITMLDKALTGSRFAKADTRPKLGVTGLENAKADGYPSTSSSKSSMVGSGSVGASGADGAGAAGAGAGEPSLPAAFAELLGAAGSEFAGALSDDAVVSGDVESASATGSVIISSSPGKRIAQFLSQTS